MFGRFAQSETDVRDERGGRGVGYAGGTDDAGAVAGSAGEFDDGGNVLI